MLQQRKGSELWGLVAVVPVGEHVPTGDYIPAPRLEIAASTTQRTWLISEGRFLQPQGPFEHAGAWQGGNRGLQHHWVPASRDGTRGIQHQGAPAEAPSWIGHPLSCSQHGIDPLSTPWAPPSRTFAPVEGRTGYPQLFPPELRWG